MRRSFLIILAFVCVGTLAFFFLVPRIPSGSFVEFKNGTRVEVDLSLTQEEQLRGLSGRATLGERDGMLFLHGDRQVRTYWMKDMLIHIDIIWIDGEKVAGLVQSLRVQEPPYDLYSSVVPVDKVLEVRAGFVTKNHVEVGDGLDIRVYNE